MKLDFFVELKYHSSTIILFVGVKQSVRDLNCDVNDRKVCVTYSR